VGARHSRVLLWLAAAGSSALLALGGLGSDVARAAGANVPSYFGGANTNAYSGGPLVWLPRQSIDYAMKKPVGWDLAHDQYYATQAVSPSPVSSVCNLDENVFLCPSLVGQSFVMASESEGDGSEWRNLEAFQKFLKRRMAVSGSGYHLLALQPIKTQLGKGLYWEYTIYKAHQIVVFMGRNNNSFMVMQSAPVGKFKSRRSLLSLIANTFQGLSDTGGPPS
jgi:hypothetical protein